MKKRSLATILALVTTLVFIVTMFTACGSGEKAEQAAPAALDYTDWDAVVKAAEGTTVTYYGWGGDANLIAWFDEVVAPKLLEKYNITFKHVDVAATSDIVSQVSAEKQAGKKAGEGVMDLIWIDGENFASCKDAGLLWGSFTDYLPNFEAYVDMDNKGTFYDSGTPIEGYETPWDLAYYVMIHDTATTSWAPATADEFLQWVKEYPGKVTYPGLPNSNGSWFVRNIIYEVCGGDVFDNLEPDYDTVKTAIEPALEYLRELNPYLWKEGKTYPADLTAVNSMFANGELAMTMDWYPYSVGKYIANGSFPETSQDFVFKNGTISSNGYLTVSYNCPNIAGALVAANEMLTPELQAARLDYAGYLSVMDFDKLSAEEIALFEQVDLGKGGLPQDEVAAGFKYPNMPYNLVEIMEKIWLDEVAGQYNQ